jgi:CO dehydrogenase maturation factor
MDDKKAKVIAYLGKGGAGKTAMAALTAHLLKGASKRVLLIDADPAMGLVYAMGREKAKTVAEARAALLKGARQSKTESDNQRLALTVDYLMLETLEECDGFSLLAMGHTEGPGCYCSVNALLRDSIEDLASNFDVIVIDAEAGIEQISRQVAQRVDHPLIVTDASLRGAATAKAIKQALARVNSPPPVGVICNRTETPDPNLVGRLTEAGLVVLGTIPLDQDLANFDSQGRSLLELPKNSRALGALKGILNNNVAIF